MQRHKMQHTHLQRHFKGRNFIDARDKEVIVLQDMQRQDLTDDLWEPLLSGAISASRYARSLSSR